MRVCWISTLLLGLFHALLLPSSSGLEGGKKIGVDDVYKPRKWSQVRDGPYRMVVSSRDQDTNETQLDSRKATRNRQGHEQYKEKEERSEAVTDTSPNAKDSSDNAETEAVTDKQDDTTTVRPSKESEEPVVHKVRIVDRRKKIKLDQGETSSVSLDNYEKNEKSTQRTITKLARKRERILSNENFRKAHRISLPEGHFSTVLPSTISHKLYNHFRPIDRGIPRESIIPFFDFGKKLSTGKPQSAINSIEGSSTPGLGGLEITTHREDDDFFHDDMDVSVVKHKAAEWNTPPRARPPPKNPDLTSYFRSNPNSNSNQEAQTTVSLPENKDDVTTTQISLQTSSPTDPTIAAPTTVIPPKSTVADLMTNESQSNKTITPSLDLVNKPTPVQEKLYKPNTSNITELTQVPRPSPTAKILSTAVVTSVSVKETYKHPRLKGLINPNAEEIALPYNSSAIRSQALKLPPDLNSSEANLENLKNQTHRSDKSLNPIVVPSTHRPSYERFVTNKTLVIKNITNIQPTTIRPKFRSNIEYHTFSPKVPITTTTHKPVNRSIYSTSQREHQKNKLVSMQHHHRSDNKTTLANQSSDANLSRSDLKNNSSSSENKSKMYLTIRSRLPNQSATYRSTFRRNSTKPIPPVLRVIATPSSYIEVPRILNRQNTTSQTGQIESDFERGVSSKDSIPRSPEDSEPGEAVTDTNLKFHLTSPNPPVESGSPKSLDSAREVRMNNHRMPTEETSTVQDTGLELTTEVVFRSLDTTEEPVVSSTSQPVKAPSNDPVSIVTASHRSTSKPKLSWVYLGQKNKTRVVDSPSVQAAYWSGFGIAAYVLAVLGIIPLILGGFILLRQILIKSKKKMLDESEYSSEYNRTPLPTKLPRITSHIMSWEGDKATSSLGTGQANATTTSVQHQSSHHQSSHHQSGQHQSSQQPLQLLHQTSQQSSLYLLGPGKWEFPREKLRLQTLLGEGNFGQVWKAEADDISGHEGLTRLVAVKTVKEGSGGREREDLLRELDIMKELGSHPNVVTLLGCCTDREPFLVIMEYVMYGKMLTFLREHRTRAHYFNFSDLNSALVSRDLTVFAYCVARGMEFLVSKGIIHRDLAARNILVDHNKLCKIADFGMSRNVRDTGEIYEQRPNRGALPIRWMAPEALHCSVFTHKSDVWSFGILVWEIITLGCTPYQTMGAREVMRRVREGYRLERPVHCLPELYKVITRCWAADSTKRPTFTDLKHDLATLLSDPQTNGAYVDLDALTEEMSSHSC